MNDFLKFLQEYKVELITGLFFVLETVFIFIKRKPKSIDDFTYCFNEVLSCVPELVSSVEEPGQGAVKKNKVLLICQRLVENHLKRRLTDNEKSFILDRVSKKIEVVLSTPVKKEIQNEK